MNNRNQTRHSHMYLELHSTGTHGMQNDSSSPGVTHSTGYRTVEVEGMRNCTDIKKGFIVIDVISGIKEKFKTVVSDIVTHIGTSST